MPSVSTSDDFTGAPTLFLLMAQYNGKTVVPMDQVCSDFFGISRSTSCCARLYAETLHCLSFGLRQAKKLSGALIW